MFGRTSHNGLLSAGLSAVLLTVPFRPWREITICNEQNLPVIEIPRELYRVQ